MDEEEQLLEVEPEKPKFLQNKRKLKICQIFFFVFGILLILVAIILPIVISKMIKSQIDGKILMQSSNEDLWGDIPGKTKTLVQRDFTFYQLQNQYDFLFFNKKPRVQETSVFSYQEFQEFTNITYLESNNQVQYAFRRYFQNISQDTSTKVNDVLNVGLFGGWQKMKSANESLLALNGLSILFQSLVKSTVPVIIAIGYQGLNISFDKFCEQASLLNDMCQWLKDDEIYGWKYNTTLVHWSQAALSNSLTSNESLMLKDYFKLTNAQFASLFNSFNTTTSALINYAVADYCKKYSPKNLPPDVDCMNDPFSLAAVQWSIAKISLDPPHPIIPFPSITLVNFTLNYMPELSNYLNDTFKTQFSQNFTDYQNVTFSVDWARKVMFFEDFDKTKKFVTANYSLLNIGNQEYLWLNGKQYDTTNNTKYLHNIKERFEIEGDENVDQDSIPKTTFVFWNYMKYFVYNFTQNVPLTGTAGQACIGQFTADALQRNYQQMKNNIILKLYSAYYYKKLIKDQNLSCYNFFTLSNIFSPEQSQLICSMKDFVNWDINSLSNLAYLCVKQNPDYILYFVQNSKSQIQQQILLCDSYLSQYTNQFTQIIFQAYNCSSLSGKGQFCSESELAQKQWYSAQITKSIPQDIKEILPQAESYYYWDQEQIDAPFEYAYFTNNIIKEEQQYLTQQQLNRLLTYDYLFSPSVIPQIFQYQKLNNSTAVWNKFFFTDSGLQLAKYYRYIMIDIVFKSLKQSRENFELLFGYTDPFVVSQKIKDPQAGGDPSLNTQVILNDPNNLNKNDNTSTVIMFTGKSDSSNTRQYYQINGFNYTTYSFSWFDGKNVQTVQATPWRDNITLQGSDSVQNPPDLSKDDKVYVYVDSFSRGGAAVWTGETYDHGGLNCYRFKNEEKFYQNATQNPENAKFYSDIYYGLQNLTKLKQAPIFLSSKHFYKVDSRLNNTTIILDINGNTVTPNPEADGLFMDIEPYSGIALAAAINAQANVLVEPDDLFDIQQRTLIPVYNTFRSGNWSNTAIDGQLGELKMALVAQKAIKIVGYTIGVLCLIIGFIFLYFFIRARRLDKKKKLIKEVQLNDEEKKGTIMSSQNQV